MILLSSKLHVSLCLTGELTYQESVTGQVHWSCSGSDLWQFWRVLSTIMPHHFHAFLHALSTKLSFWKNRTPHYLKDLVSLEQWTKFFSEIPAQGLSLLSMWHLLPQVALSLLASCCVDFLAEWRCWLQQWLFGVNIHLWNWLVCQLLRKVCIPELFLPSLGIVRFSGFLRNLQLYTVERVLCLWDRRAISESLWDRPSWSFQDHHKIRKEYSKSLAELMRSVIIFLDASLARKFLFAPSRFTIPLWKVLQPFKIGCFRAIYTSVTCFASSSHFPFGLSGYLSNFQVSSEPRPMYMKYPGLNFPKQAALLHASHRNCALPPFGPCEEIEISFIITKKNSMKVGYWSKMLSIFSLDFSNPLIDVEHYLIRLITRKFVEYEWICSPSNIFAVSLQYARCCLHLSVNLISGMLIACFPRHRTGNLRKRELRPRAFSTTRCQRDHLSHKPFCFARFEPVTRSARGCLPHS